MPESRKPELGAPSEELIQEFRNTITEFLPAGEDYLSVDTPDGQIVILGEIIDEKDAADSYLYVVFGEKIEGPNGKPIEQKTDYTVYGNGDVKKYFDVEIPPEPSHVAYLDQIDARTKELEASGMDRFTAHMKASEELGSPAKTAESESRFVRFILGSIEEAETGLNEVTGIELQEVVEKLRKVFQTEES